MPVREESLRQRIYQDGQPVAFIRNFKECKGKVIKELKPGLYEVELYRTGEIEKVRQNALTAL